MYWRSQSIIPSSGFVRKCKIVKFSTDSELKVEEMTHSRCTGITRNVIKEVEENIWLHHVTKFCQIASRQFLSQGFIVHVCSGRTTFVQWEDTFRHKWWDDSILAKQNYFLKKKLLLGANKDWLIDWLFIYFAPCDQRLHQLLTTAAAYLHTSCSHSTHHKKCLKLFN